MPGRGTVGRRGFVLGTAATLLPLSRPGWADTAAAGPPIVCWGDRLPFGAGASTDAHKFPVVLAASFTPPRET